MQNARPLPKLSVLVAIPPDSPRGVPALMRGLAAQTCPAGAFELVAVAADAEAGASLRADEQPFPCTVVVRPGECAAAARNVATLLAQAPLVLFVDEFVEPAPDLVERHLAAHAELGSGVAVVGALPFSTTALESPLARMIDTTPALRPWSSMDDGADVGWPMFRSSNLSVAAASVVECGGFDDANFGDLCGDDVELGLRMTQRGLRVVHRADCIATSHRVLGASAFVARAVNAGRAVVRMHRIHGDVVPCWPTDPAERVTFQDGLVARIESGRVEVEDQLDALVTIERDLYGRPMDRGALERAGQELVQLAEHYRIAGMHHEHTGVDPFAAVHAGAASGTTVSIIVISLNALQTTQRCVDALRAGADARYSQEIIVIDNGSTDGSAEWLAQQPDVHLIRNEGNYGAPRARNQALGVATGEWIAFLDGDVFVPSGWLERALYHGAADPSVGSIPLCANRASRHQVVPYDGPHDAASIDAFAAKHYASSPREGKDTVLFTSLAVLVRREAMQRIGGWDEAFSPWGFDDDDLALRIHLAGWRNRVARDTFVFHAPYPTQEKVERHAGWLEANWRAFLAKWSPNSGNPALFDYTNVVVPTRESVREDQLYFAIPPDDAPPPNWETGRAQEVLGAMDALEAVDTLGEFIARTARDLEERTRDARREAASETHAQATPVAESAMHVVVMSAPCSGAHAITSALATSGWSAGDASTPATPGFRSFEEVIGVNEWILSGSSIDESPLPRMLHWLAHPRMDRAFTPDGERARRIARLAERGPLALDDPRLCFTLSEWRDALGRSTQYLCLFRDPGSCADDIVRAAAAADCPVDREHALHLWNDAYRRILDDHAQNGEWLFLHAETLASGEAQQSISELLGCDVAPEAWRPAAASSDPVPANVARTYEDLCLRAQRACDDVAGLPRPVEVTSIAAPELSVIVCVQGSRDVLRRSLLGLEEQTAVGRFEIVVVVDDTVDDRTREMLDRWPLRAPLRVVNSPQSGLAASRNAGLHAASGDFVLFLDADLDPARDLVEQHLRAHGQHGAATAILGDVQPGGAARERALARASGGSGAPPSEPGVAYDWNRFHASNLSVALMDIRVVGGFDEDFDRFGGSDVELGVRLCDQLGMHVWFVPEALATREAAASFEEVRDATRRAAAARVHLFQKHPIALEHPMWRDRAVATIEANETLLIRTLPDRARAESFARELAGVNVGVLERSGPEGDRLVESVGAELSAYLAELQHIWSAEGECDALRGLGMTELSPLSSAA